MEKTKMQRILDRIQTLETEVEEMYYKESGEDGEIHNNTVEGLDTVKTALTDVRAAIRLYGLC